MKVPDQEKCKCKPIITYIINTCKLMREGWSGNKLKGSQDLYNTGMHEFESMAGPSDPIFAYAL